MSMKLLLYHEEGATSQGTNVRLYLVKRVNYNFSCITAAYPRILFGVGVQQIQLRTEHRENGDLGAVAFLVRGSGGSCNLIQEISFRIVKFS